MKIAQVAPLIERVPPKKYGGTERVVFALTEELVRRGHEVTLFASGDSITSAKLVYVYPKSLREVKIKDLYAANSFTLHNIGLAYSLQDQFDVIHDHNSFMSLPTANIARTPVVMTIHGPFTPQDKHMFRMLTKPSLITISNSQAVSEIANIAGTVYNGLNMESYPYYPEHDGYLLFVGRISMEKGAHNAIEIAQYLNLPLIIAAKLETVDVPYFKQYVEPHLSENIKWIGEVNEDERNQLMSRALCFLHPITWSEPFGLTMIEAMACGCPVVGFNKGSVPELIKHGETGFIVNDIEEAINAIAQITNIDRMACRTHALENFSAQKMADGYEAVYQQVIKKKGQITARSNTQKLVSI